MGAASRLYGSGMVLPQNGKAVANESNYPYIVELAIGVHELDSGLSHRIIEFHQLRHIKPRHGRTIVRGGKVHYRWCFSDLATARAFVEQFGGEFFKSAVF